MPPEWNNNADCRPRSLLIAGGRQPPIRLSLKERMTQMKKRYLVEFGTGADLHGGDVTKAAQKALKDAISHCCMCGLAELFGDDKGTPPAVTLKVKLAAPWPDRIDVSKALTVLPGGGSNAEVEVVTGGLHVTGLHVDALGEGDQIVLVNAAITVCIEV